MSLGEEGQQHKNIRYQQGKLENEDEPSAVQPSLVTELSSLENTDTAAKDYQDCSYQSPAQPSNTRQPGRSMTVSTDTSP